jgi:hypothetical protein
MTLRPVLAAFFAALALGAASSHAATQPAPGRQCFYARDVDGFAAADDHGTVYIRVGVNDVYALKLLGTCPDVDWTLKLGLASRGGDFICSGLDAELVVPGAPLGPQRCPVSELHKLSPAEVAALPPKLRP